MSGGVTRACHNDLDSCSGNYYLAIDCRRDNEDEAIGTMIFLVGVFCLVVVVAVGVR